MRKPSDSEVEQAKSLLVSLVESDAVLAHHDEDGAVVGSEAVRRIAAALADATEGARAEGAAERARLVAALREEHARKLAETYPEYTPSEQMELHRGFNPHCASCALLTGAPDA